VKGRRAEIEAQDSDRYLAHRRERSPELLSRVDRGRRHDALIGSIMSPAASGWSIESQITPDLFDRSIRLRRLAGGWPARFGADENAPQLMIGTPCIGHGLLTVIGCLSRDAGSPEGVPKPMSVPSRAISDRNKPSLFDPQKRAPVTENASK
jgi:hypothetical protein